MTPRSHPPVFTISDRECTPSVLLRTRSLSAGSDLDKLKILSDQTGGKINSLVNLTSVGASPHTARRLSSNASPVPVAAAGSVLLTESIQSINKGSGFISRVEIAKKMDLLVN